MGFTFETFKRQDAKRKKSEPTVTVLKNGNISPSKDALDLLGRPVFVLLLFDKAQRVVGIRPVDKESEYTYRIGKADMISGKAFCNYFGIDYETSRRYPAHIYNDILIFNL